MNKFTNLELSEEKTYLKLLNDNINRGYSNILKLEEIKEIRIEPKFVALKLAQKKSKFDSETEINALLNYK